MPIDFSILPDQPKKKEVDFSRLPDQPGTGIELSGLPDQPTTKTILGVEPTGGTWWSAAKAAVKVPLAVGGALAAAPGAGIEAIGKLLPRISTDPDKLIEMGSLKEAEATLQKRIGAIPGAVITTPEEVESMEKIEKYGMWPIRKAGEGWGMIGKATGIPYAEPTLATIGEAATMGAIGGKSIKLLKARGKATMRGLAAKNIEKLRMAQESKYGRYGVVPEEGLLIEGTPSVKPVPVPQIPKAEKQGLKVMDLIGKRRAEIDKGILDSEIFIKQFEREFTPTELEAIPFIREGIKDPNILKKIGKEELIPIIEKTSPTLLAATEKIDKYYDESFKFLEENWGDVGFVEDYVTHIWDIPKGRKSEVVNYFAIRNPFTKKRRIPTLEEGIKLGLKPKTTNITELLRIYDQYKIKTVHNLNFAKGLKDLVGVDGEPLMMRSDKAPVDWVTIDHPAMNRAMFVGKAGEKPILAKIPVKVHPEIAKEVKIIFDKPFSHGAIQALETVNAFAKKGMLSLSFFHHHALTESAFSTGIGLKALKQWNPYKIVKALRNKDYEIFKRQELAKDGIDHGLTFGALSDVQRNRVANSLKSLERIAKDTPGAKQLTKGMRKANELWDAALWDYYHNSLKLWAYEKNVFDALKFSKKKVGRDLLPNEIKAFKTEMAKFVNDSFGGQNWELNKVLGNPKVRQMLHWALLAPDWTFSVLKQAAAPAKGLYLQAKARKAPTAEAYIQKKLAGKALTRQGTKFWAKAALYFNIIAQSVNYFKTKEEYGKGRFTWDNPEGHYLNIFMGRNKDGTEKYLRMGKQFREVLEWGLNPIKKVGAKLSPGVREGIRQITAHDPGSGYPTEWAEKEGIATIPERLMSIAEMPIPFSLRPYVKSRPGVFMFTFPTSKGMTNYKAVDIFKKALKDKDVDRVRKTYIDALQNNLDAEQLFKTARSSMKADITYDNKKLAYEIFHEIKTLDPKAQKDALLLYKKKGVLTPEILQQYLKIKEKQTKIERQKVILLPRKTIGGLP